MSDGGNDPEKHKYTRAIAFSCLWSALLIAGFMVITVYKEPDMVKVYTVLYTTITTPMWLQVAWYMGISNGFGFKK